MSILNVDFTGGDTQEAGLFEEIMRSVKSHLKLEYDANRIKGAEYANVYLGSLQSAMGISSQFVLTKETTNQQNLLLQEQVIGQTKQNLLLDAQIAKVEVDTLLASKQLVVLDEQIALTIQQTAKVTQEALQSAKQVEVGTKQLLVMDSQIAQSNTQTSMIGNQETNIIAERANISKVGLKLDAEKGILVQKKSTEVAQTVSTMSWVDISRNQDGSDMQRKSSVGGILGAQEELYAKQTAGYDRDAEQKTAKIFADFYNVNRTTETDIYPSSYGASGVNCVAVFDVLRAGIGVGKSDTVTL